jgi:PAS domain S-box-containing protein
MTDQPPAGADVRTLQAQLQACTLAHSASEERYRQLFDAIDEGFCVVQVIFDAQDRPRDLVWLEANRSFEHQTGLPRPVGRGARDLVPDLDDSWLDIFGRVARSRQPIRFQKHAAALNRWFDVYAFPVDAAEDAPRIATLFRDITAEKREEVEMKRRADGLAVLSDGAAALLAGRDPADLLDSIYPRLASLLTLDVYVHHVLNEDGIHLDLKTARGVRDAHLASLRCIGVGEAICGEVARTRRRWVIDDLQLRDDNATALARAAGMTNYVCTPLVADALTSEAARERTEALGGEFKLSSELGDGTAVDILIP